MTYVSLEFFVLLVFTFGLYYFLPQRARIWMMLVISYIFYSYWNIFYGVLLFISTLMDYTVAIIIENAKKSRTKKLALLVSVTGNLSLLGYFKYTNFALDSLKNLLGPLGHMLPGTLEIVLPAGISFYTFQIMSYTIDVYRGQQKCERNFALFALYVSFFPQLVAGPIERARDLLNQLKVKQPFQIENIEAGLKWMLWGFLKKTVFADRLVYAALPAFHDPAHCDPVYLFFSATAMMIALYLDFSAYSEIATGVARLFGVRLTKNFYFPYIAGNIAEFWRRWHMSMSTWVRDYVFLPLGGYRPRHLWHFARTMLITMGLVGIWHGAKWTFVFWGLGHGLLLVLYHAAYIKFLRKLPVRRFWLWRFGSWVINMIFRSLLGVLFFSPNLKSAGIFYKRLFLPWSFHEIPTYLLFGFLGLGLFWVFHYLHYFISQRIQLEIMPFYIRSICYILLFCASFFGAVSTAKEFIYFQF